MPENIRDRTSQLIDTAIDARIIPAATIIDHKISDLSTAQASSTDIITRNLREVGKTTVEAIHTTALEGREATKRIENRLERILISQEISSEADTELCAKIKNISIAQSISTDLVVRCAQASQDTTNASRLHALETRAQSSSVHRKLDEVVTSISTIQDSLHCLSTSRLALDSDLSQNKVVQAIQDMMSSIWLLLSSLQILTRELV